MPTNSHIFEIKLLFPKNKFEVIEQWIISKEAVRRQHLYGAYIDTPDFLLTQAGVTFRLKKEGRHWAQTLTIITDNPFEMLEHEVVRQDIGIAAPNWDLHLHPQYEQLLKDRIHKLEIQELQIICETDIWRRKVVITDRYGIIQYALDKGVISSPSPSGAITAPIQELSIKLMKGEPRNVLNHARKMIKNYEAFIDTRSISEYGLSLSSRLEFGTHIKAKYDALKSSGDSYEIISRLIDSCMQQVLVNQTALNMECQSYDEYLHQLRIGLRRLKVLFKYLAKDDIYISDKGIEIFNRVFSMFGQYRNDNYVANVLNPTLLSLGSSEIMLDDIAGLPNPAHITRDKDFQLLLIEIMSFSHSQCALLFHPAADKKNIEGAAMIKRSFIRLVDSRFQFLVDRASKFLDLSDEEIHLMRKKMKFIRYSLDFFKDFCIKKVYPNFYKAITRALDYFGLFNDICVTINRIEESSKNNSNLLFAINWLKFKRKQVRLLCGKSLKKLIHTPTPWDS